MCTGASANLAQAECESWIDLYDSILPNGTTWPCSAGHGGGIEAAAVWGNRLDPCICSDWGVVCSSGGGHITGLKVVQPPHDIVGAHATDEQV